MQFDGSEKHKHGLLDTDQKSLFFFYKYFRVILQGLRNIIIRNIP